MSLPACQQRVLDHIDQILQAGEPHLAAMYAVFARLNAGEPVVAEPLGRGWPAWRGPHGTRGTAVCAAVLVPVMFAMIALGVLLGGSARGATTCGVSHSTLRGAPWSSHGLCPPGRAARAKASMTGQPVSCVVRMRGARLGTPSPSARIPAAALRSATC
jgi:hypothetical protein